MRARMPRPTRCVRAVDGEQGASPEHDASVGRRSSRPSSQLLDWLEAERASSRVERFAESRVHARAARFGNRCASARSWRSTASRSTPRQLAALAASELRACRRPCARASFAAPRRDAGGARRQARFLAGRGFSPRRDPACRREACGAERPTRA